LLIDFIPSFIILTLWIGYGIEYLWVKGKGYSVRVGGNLKTYRLLGVLLILVLPISPLLNNYSFNDRSRHYLAYDYGMNILNTLDKDAILFVHGDTLAFSMVYLKLVEKKRPDVTVYDRTGNLFEDIYGFYKTDKKWTRKEWVVQRDRVEREIVTTTSRPVYYCPRRDMSQIPGFELRPSGLVYRLVKKGAPLRKEPDYYSRYILRGVNDEKVFKDMPSNEIVAIYHYSLAQHYWTEEDLKQVVEEAKKASQAGWNIMGVHYNLGLMFQEYEIYDQAIEAYERAIELNPDFERAYDNLGIIYAQLGQPEKAVSLFKKAIELNPSFANPHNNLGNVYGERGWYDQALEEFEKALELEPDLPGVHYNMGLAYYKKKDYQRAWDEFKKVPRHDPNYRIARQYLRAARKGRYESRPS
jgi:superkiller protein 3